MTTRLFRVGFTAVLTACLALSACRPEPNHPPPPPPPPPLPVPVPVPAPDSPLPGTPPPMGETEAQAEPRGAQPAGTRVDDERRVEAPPVKEREAREQAVGGEKPKPREGGSLYDLAKEGKAKLPVAAAVPAAKPASTKPPAAEPVKPAPTKPVAAMPAPAKPATKVVIPRTDHVFVDVPKGLQAYLDADPRMQPWSKQVINVIDKCYASERKKNANAAGVIEVKVTMHENSRPDADVKSLPPQLSGVVACATGGLMRTKMPLFTGKEGDRHTVRVHFEK